MNFFSPLHEYFFKPQPLAGNFLVKFPVQELLFGVDRPARLPSSCFSLFHSLARTSISLSDRPLLYEMRGGSL